MCEMEGRIQKEVETVLSGLSTNACVHLILYDVNNGVDNRDIRDEVVKRVRERHVRRLTVFNFYAPERVNGRLVRVVSFNLSQSDLS
jgi:hypothetical protein